jgi:hypothetical protein
MTFGGALYVGTSQRNHDHQCSKSLPWAALSVYSGHWFWLQIDRCVFLSLKRDFFSEILRLRKKVVAVFRELPASVAALDRLGLSLTMTLNDGAVAAQNCYARRDTNLFAPWGHLDTDAMDSV